MANIHQLIVQHGHRQARDMVGADERRYVDLAAEWLANENQGLGITYSGFCLTCLPHKKLPDDQHWERPGPKVTLLVEPGRLRDQDGKTKLYGVPYGSRARLILLYLQTRVVQSGSLEVELGRSMREWMSRMGVPIGGTSYREVRDQANRISACHLTFLWDSEKQTKFAKDSIVDGGIQLYETDDDQQLRLWVDTVRLSDRFFKALREHPVPVSEAAIKLISNQSLSLDVYIWLAYRLHVLQKPTAVSWLSLHQQFGFAYKNVFHFKPRFIEALKMATMVYEQARVEVDQSGVVLHPSAPPVPERSIGILR